MVITLFFRVLGFGVGIARTGSAYGKVGLCGKSDCIASLLGRFAVKNHQAASRSAFGMTDVACDGSESSLGECLHR